MPGQAIIKLGIIAAATWALAGVLIWALPDRGELQLTMLDVGQGDSLLIESPSHARVLVDAGLNSAVLAPLGRELPALARRIDLIVLTHPDADHISGFSEILRRYQVGRVLMTGVLQENESSQYRDILDQIAAQRIPVSIAQAGQVWDLGGGARLEILAPAGMLAGQVAADTNATSIVARLKWGETAALLTGDADFAAETRILKQPFELQSQILKLGHHGAKTSSSSEFVAASQAEIGLISAGADNSYGHPAPETLERIRELEKYETAKSGSVEFISNGKTWQAIPEKSAPSPAS